MKIKEGVPLPNPPSEHQIQGFNQEQSIGGPTPQQYLIDYAARPSSKWNERAFEVFFDTFIPTIRARELFIDERENTDQPLSNDILEEIVEKKRRMIKDMWKIHFRGLRDKYKRQESDRVDPLSREARKDRWNRDQRRQTVSFFINLALFSN